jgi:hypothetical protein
MLGDRRNDGHEVRFTGAVIANDEKAFIVGGLAELQLRKHELAEHLRHAVGDDECFDQTTGICGGVGFSELDDRFDRLELNEV